MGSVRDVQLALIARGFDVGRSGADDQIGPATGLAVCRSFASPGLSDRRRIEPEGE